MSREWDDFSKFDKLSKEYLPFIGEGETLATQAVTAVSKLVYRWFNDGDVYDNTQREGWANDLSSYANWLEQNLTIGDILAQVWDADVEYVDILWELCEKVFREDYLKELASEEKVGSVYKCSGRFKFEDDYDEEEDW